MPKSQEPWINDYINEIKSASSPNYWKTHTYCSEGMIRCHHFPEKTYRYREICDRECDTISKSSIWLSSFEKFKDDDCLVYLEPDKLHLWNKIRVLRDYCLNKVGFDRINLPYEKCFVGDDPQIWLENVISLFNTISAETREIDTNAKYIELMSIADKEDYLSYFRKTAFNGVGICCFSQSYKESQLWRKYSNKTTNNKIEDGMCIEYNFTSLSTKDIQKKLIYPVYYSDIIPDISPIVFHNLTTCENAYNYFLLNIILTKRTEFIYENEWRLVIPNIILDGKAGNTFPMIKPSAIYLGHDATIENQEIVLNTARQCGIRVIKLHKLQENEYGEVIIYDPPNDMSR